MNNAALTALRRQLPWRVLAPNLDEKHCRVVDDAGHLVCVCHGEDEGRAEAVVICEAINRAGDKACANCGEPAACFGSYETELNPAYACDECCAHGNEDGHCEPVTP